MNPEPLVSVVIIFLNAEKFIAEAIQSVLAQTYARWELLLVDDGSSDASAAIAKAYARQFPGRVCYLEHPAHANRGMSAARNLGIRHAAGDYVAFLDADDIWFSNTLAEQRASFDAHPEVAMVYGPIQWWYSWTEQTADQTRDYVERLGVSPNTVIRPPVLLPLFLRDRAAVPSGILVRRETIDQVQGFEDTFRGEYEDQVFCAKVCLKAPVFASGQCWYRYRQHAHSCVALGQKTGATHSARLAFLHWLAAYLTDQHVKAPAVWWALWLELWRETHPRAFYLLRRPQQLAKQFGGLLARYQRAA